MTYVYALIWCKAVKAPKALLCVWHSFQYLKSKFLSLSMSCMLSSMLWGVIREVFLLVTLDWLRWIGSRSRSMDTTTYRKLGLYQRICCKCCRWSSSYRECPSATTKTVVVNHNVIKLPPNWQCPPNDDKKVG